MGDLNASTKRRVALFLDGTWNTLWDNTNVWRLKSLCKPSDDQVLYYSQGVGTRAGEKIRGGALGYGIDQEVMSAYEWLIENYNESDHIYIFGFSRGAYTARSLSGLISKCGLLRPGAALSARELYDRYRQGGQIRTIRELMTAERKGQKKSFSQQEQWILKYCTAPTIWFLGVWDTVGSLGIPFGDIPHISRDGYKFLETDLRINNDRAFHALAIDENRIKFAPTLFTHPKNSTREARPLSEVEQRWFVGAHSNVGGGYSHDLLAQLPLKWLMDKAILHGLEFRNTIEVDGDLYQAPITDSYSNFLHGFYKHLPFVKRYHREIEGKPISSNLHTEEIYNINETIDVSVFNRWRADDGYRPKSISGWADKHGVNPGEIKKSVMANNPSVAVDDIGAPDGNVTGIA